MVARSYTKNDTQHNILYIHQKVLRKKLTTLDIVHCHCQLSMSMPIVNLQGKRIVIMYFLRILLLGEKYGEWRLEMDYTER